MKKIIIFAFVLALVFSLCACACSKETMEPIGTTDATTEPTTVTIMPTTEMTIPVPETNIPDPSINTDPIVPDSTTPGTDATILPRSGILQ